jgi:tRNA threonylcarbamoyladenosine biosynthesis protein TsaB
MILAINSSTFRYGIAILTEKGSVITEHISPSGEQGFTGFMPFLDSLFVTSGIDCRDIKAVIVAIGPGSFTGLRVGLSAAKGLAHGLDIPIIGVSSTEALATQISSTKMKICSMITSRKDEVFYAVFYRDENHLLIRLHDDTSIKLRQLAGSVKSPQLFIGNNYRAQVDIIKELSGDIAAFAPEDIWCLKPSSIGILGLRRFQKGDFDDIRDIVPSYLRPPDIRPNPYQTLKSHG